MSPRILLASFISATALLGACGSSEEPTEAVNGLHADEGQSEAQLTNGAPSASGAALLSDAALPEGQAALLELAFAAPSKLPLDPHVKNRARGQETVILAALETQQFALAYRLAQEVPNWRKGTALADLAHALLEQDERADVLWLLDEAMEVAMAPAAEVVDQSWRRDRIRAKVAGVYLKLGLDEEAQKAAVGVEASEAIHFEQAFAPRLSAEEVDQQLEAVPTLLQSASFEQAVSILTNLAIIYENHYEDVERRERTKQVLRDEWSKVPALVHIDLTLRMARAAIAADDLENARALCEDARAYVSNVTITPDEYVRLLARVALVRAEAGATQEAIDSLDAAMQIYDAEREKIVDMFRAEVLQPVAEAYLVAGSTEKAAKLYAQAIEEGALNPNGRPRAIDFAGTLSSMVRSGFTPGAELRARMDEVFQGLQSPW